jgi:hypothetical protein
VPDDGLPAQAVPAELAAAAAVVAGVVPAVEAVALERPVKLANTCE